MFTAHFINVFMLYRYGTLQKRSTAQMKYRWETLTSKLDMKTSIMT